MIKWNILSSDLILSSLRPNFDEIVLETYFSKIYHTLSSVSPQIDSSYLSLESFEEYLNMPLIITHRLHQIIVAKASGGNGNDQLKEEDFIQCMLKYYYSKDIEAIVHFTFEFLDCYNNKLIQGENPRLLLYYFHSMTNKTSINQIDTILSKCFGHDNKEISFDEFKESLKTNSDIIFLLLFYFKTYQPFDKEILFLCKNWQCNKNTSNIVTATTNTTNPKNSIKESFNIAKPSDAVISYLKNEFGFDLLESCCSDQTSLTENTIEKEEPKSVLNSIGDYMFTKRHLVILSEFTIYPLINSMIESSFEGNGHQTINVCRLNCDSKPLIINEKLNNDFNKFSLLYNIFNPKRNIEDYYSLSQVISQGNFSTIKLALRRVNTPNKNNTTSNKPYIVKIINKSIPCGYKWDKDISKFLMKNTHPNVINCIDIFETKTDLYLIFEYYYDGSLLDYLMKCYEKLSSDEIENIITQLLSGLAFLQKFGIVHRDIKPENILVAQPFEIKINDFGLSKVMFPKEKTQESYGSLCYASPEIISHKWYNHKTDLWSIGVISYYLQFAQLPFNDEDENEEEFNSIARKIIKCDYSLPDDDEENIVRKCTLAYKAIKLFLIAEDKRVNLKDFINKYVKNINGKCL